MMLNNNAEELEALDRADILSCLPDLDGKDAVDIGAGIGRFTAVLADTARYVLSTDFIESFIHKNQELNSHRGNISYQVGDAVHLQLDSDSVDLVFTNWLMMYLTDKEVIQFLFNALRWLRPNGYIHLRESCSEPSTARTTGTMHSTSDANPTSYRFSSLYIKLFRNIRWRDASGNLYRFEVLWSCSVPTYIMRQYNWRQVHWLLSKVKAETNDEPSFDCLLSNFSINWKQEQIKWDRILDDEGECWTDQVFEYVLLRELTPKNTMVLAYNPRISAYHVHINAHFLSEKFTCNVWNIETNEYFYRTSLTKANHLKDQRVRFGWNRNLDSAVEYWMEKSAAFDVFLATELLSTSNENTIKKLTHILRPEAPIVLLEPFEEGEYSEEAVKHKLGCFQKVTVDDVTNVCWKAINNHLGRLKQEKNVIKKEWKLICARA